MKIGLKGLFLTIIATALFSASAIAKPLNVVATTGMIADLVENIGQDKVNVISLMGPGVDPHLYRATQGDLRRLQNADIIFYNGLYLEGQMGDVFASMAKKKPVFAVTAGLDSNQMLQGDEGYAYDPHVWFDVSLWRKVGDEVLARLIEVDVDNKAFFQKNAVVYFAKLDTLHIWVKDQVKQVPKSQRVLVTAHDAFGYFGNAYGFEVRALQGMSTASEFGLRDIKVLKDLIIARDINAVFVEASVPRRFLESVVQGVQAEGKDLKIGGELFSDAMGLTGTPEGTYIGMIKHNINTIVSVLK